MVSCALTKAWWLISQAPRRQAAVVKARAVHATQPADMKMLNGETAVDRCSLQAGHLCAAADEEQDENNDIMWV